MTCTFVRSQWFESSKIHAGALIIGELSDSPSHWSSVRSLDQWLREQGVPGVQGETSVCLSAGSHGNLRR